MFALGSLGFDLIAVLFMRWKKKEVLELSIIPWISDLLLRLSKKSRKFLLWALQAFFLLNFKRIFIPVNHYVNDIFSHTLPKLSIQESRKIQSSKMSIHPTIKLYITYISSLFPQHYFNHLIIHILFNHFLHFFHLPRCCFSFHF